MTFSLSASNPLFPSLMPRLVDPLWFKVDTPQDENAELTKLEKEHADWLKSIGERDTALLPIGKTRYWTCRGFTYVTHMFNPQRSYIFVHFLFKPFFHSFFFSPETDEDSEDDDDDNDDDNDES